MSDRGYIIRDQFGIHFITFAVVQWVDVFNKTEYSDIVVDSLKYCQTHKGLQVHAWRLMSNHIHLIVSTREPHKLSDVLRDFKKFTSKMIMKSISDNMRESRRSWMLWIFKTAGEQNSRNKGMQFWQQENHPILCDTNDILETRLTYLHENPIRAGFVRNEWDYVYSSGIDYYTEGKGLIDIDFLL